ncbi:MAG: hypothetical protein K6T73_01200 [Candidatus Bathyarchaeota archaeon]|nr:hypothetical protein [Candidatus Bathyarchaeota archaeon]
MKIIKIIIIPFLLGALTALLLVGPIRSQIQQAAGLAVAASPTKWNNVKDVSVGDEQTSGLLASGPYVYDNANWKRLRGDAISGVWVNVKASSSLPVYTTTSSSITADQVVVGESATVIVQANANRRSVIIRNQGSTDMYIGGSEVTSSTGLLIKPDEAIVLDRTTAAIYGSTLSGSTTVGYLEE